MEISDIFIPISRKNDRTGVRGTFTRLRWGIRQQALKLQPMASASAMINYTNHPVPDLRQRLHESRYDIAKAVDVFDVRLFEPLVDVKKHGIAGENYYAISDGRNPPYRKRMNGSIDGLFARFSVVNRLISVNESFIPYNVELFLFDAFRPLECQVAIWDFFSKKIHAESLHLSEMEIEKIIAMYVSDPTDFRRDDPLTCPLHITGGAVDLSLRDRFSKKIINVGGAFDEMSEISHTCFFEKELQLGNIADDDPRLLNRRILYWAMNDAGFTNYPFEFWHFDYGNKMYASMMYVLNATPKIFYSHAEIQYEHLTGY